MRVLIGGGSGFLGTYLVRLLQLKGHEPVILSRSSLPGGLTWDDLYKKGLPGNIDAVVNLSGHNLMDISKRWNQDFQHILHVSRIDTTKKLAELIDDSKNPPSVFVTSSAIGYYKTSQTVEYTEDSPGGDSDFLSTLCRDWEQAGQLGPDTKCRHVTVRIGLALGYTGGTMAAIRLPFFLGVGGKIGSGKQWFPWIHAHDVAGIIEYSITNEHVTGILNAVAPQTNTNAEFTQAFSRAIWRPAVIPVPGFALKLLYGPVRAAAMLEGQKVLPKRTLDLGYEFKYPDLTSACTQLSWLFPPNDDPPV